MEVMMMSRLETEPAARVEPILTNGEEQDIALRLRHGTTETILTLIR